jgi:hypothetical protein
MTLDSALLPRAFNLAILGCASLLVPARRRSEWWKEWRSELWHVRQASASSTGIAWTAEREVARFCFGAFPDALCLRGFLGQHRIPRAPTVGSAAQCIRLLAVLAVLGYGAALLLPGVNLARRLMGYRQPNNLVLIQAVRDDARYAGYSSPSISPAQYLSWKRRRQNLFDDFAFYQIAPLAISSTTPAANIAVSSANLLQLLGIPVRFALAAPNISGTMPRLILSDAMWKRDFAADPQISGRIVQIASQSVLVSGVALEGAWRLPGKVDAWLLEPAPGPASKADGFVIAHLKPSALHTQWGPNWALTAPQPDGTMADFWCSSIANHSSGPNQLFLFAVFLACLALPATTSLPLGEYRVTSQKLPWSTRLRRWAFLASKLALLTPIVYFVSLDLAHLRTFADPASSAYIQLIAAFSICLFGLRWALRDQRQRCPICLRRLTHPARVGHASRSFLAWNGTELICSGGHGLLHIPELQTSWFNTQRWLYLDPSWDVLFADPTLASATYF